jgi:hypothetical protein
MRVLATPVTLLVIALIVYLVIVALRGPSRAEHTKAIRSAAWQTATEMKDGTTIVLVKQVAEVRGETIELARQVVAEIPDKAPDWDARYHEAMAEARSRASALQIESD